MPVASLPITAGTPVSAKPKKTVGGFLGNFAKGGAAAVGSVLAFPFVAAYSAGDDLYDAFNGGGYSSRSADLVRGVVHGLNDYYIAPFRSGGGGLDQFWDNVYANPAQLTIDLATLGTGAGAVAGRVGSKVAKVAKPGSAAQKAGLRVSGLKTTSKAFSTLAPREARGAIRLADDTAAIPQRINIKTSTGKTPYSYAAPRNPVIRARKKALERAYARWGGENTALGRLTNSYMHPDVRAARLAKADSERLMRRTAYQQAGRAAELEKALTRAESKAIFYRVPGFRSADDLAKLIRQRVEDLEIAKQTAGGKPSRDVLMLEDDLRVLNDPEVQAAITNPSPKVLEAEQAFLDLSDVVQGMRAARGKEDDWIARARQPLESVRGIVADDPARGRIGVISYSTKREVGGRLTKGRTARKPGSMTKELRTGMDMESTGAAFRKALYTPDPKKILETYAVELNHIGSVANWHQLLLSAVPFNAHEHSELIQSGKLIHVTPDSTLAKNIAEMTDFITNRLLPVADDMGDFDVIRTAAILDSWSDEIGAGRGVVIPAAYAKALANDAASSVGLIRRLLTKPTKVWRDFALALKGSFYFNNIIGNLVLGIVAYGPKYIPEVIFGGHLRSKSGLAARIHRALPDIDRGNINVLREWMHNEPAFGRLNPLRLVSQSADNIAEFMSKGTEANFRKAAAAMELKSEAARYAKEAGVSRAEAIDAILNDARAVDAIAEKVYGDMLDYSKLTPFERDYLRTVYPFWNFMREITRRTINLALDEPWKIAVMNEMSKVSMREQEDLFEGLRDVPPHLRGLMPIGMKRKDGTTPVVSMYAANPFSGAADNINQIGTLLSGDLAETAANPLAQMNPFVKSGLEALTGRDMFFDQPLVGSRSQIFANQSLRQFPLYSMYERARFPNPNSIVQRSGRQMAGQYMGVSTGSFNQGAALRSQAISDYYARKEQQRRMRYDATRRSRDIGWDLGLINGARGMVSG